MKLRDYLRMAVIINPLPNNIINGQVIDAVPVMANFNWIVAQVNSNVPSGDSGVIAWTPTLKFGGGSTGITYATQSGVCVKFGRFVYWAFTVILTAKGSSTGQARVAGIPFTPDPSWLGNNGGPVYSEHLTFPTGYQMFFYDLPTSDVGIVTVRTASTVLAADDTDFANNTEIAGSGFFAAT